MISTLEALRNLDWTQAIPGHGVVQRGKSQLDKLIAFMKDVVSGVQAAAAKNLALDQAKAGLDLSKHSASFPNFKNGSVAMIERAWAEVTGKIQD